ncbi:hypothetical protein J7337_001123 [Fusarium musae]|uniref:Uncharacterized protein n=1 Tax=Fusarium musae TaxID=1042133 RepID=A0A9P8DT99_9HYPO|nr:hypothetical protein J7337_001123 [Fusarium musae]KAG9507570.1 hypothetical protein J7337_001123 [Fusarium musae]
MVGARQKTPKPGHPPTSGIALSDPSNNLAQGPAIVVNVDELPDPRNHHAARARGASEPPASQTGPQSRLGGKPQVSAAQYLNNCTAWATARNMESQHRSPAEILGPSHGVPSEEDSKVIRQAQTSFDQLVSLAKRSTSQSTEVSDASEIAALQERLGKEQQNNQRLTGDHRNLTKEHKRLNRDYREQRSQLYEANTRLRDTLLERDHLRQLLEGGTFANSAKITDTAILDAWKELSYNIRDLAYTLAQAQNVEDPSEVVISRLRCMAQGYKKLLQDQDYSHALMQGYLWRLIHQRIFRPKQRDGQFWGGLQITSLKLGKDEVYSKVMSKEGKNSDDWATLAHAARSFSQISVMFNKLWNDNNGLIKTVVSRETELLTPFFLRRSPRTDRTQGKINEQLTEIFKSAIELDKMMMCSQAYFMIEWNVPGKKPPTKSRYDKDSMESVFQEVKLSPKSLVEFLASPILSKSGTADGQKYNIRNVLAKASVICN